MNSGSREFDFNTMADVGKQVSENKKALDDVRSSFVGPTQEEDAPEPTPVVLDGPATEEGDDNKVNLNELAYAAKRHLEEVGHPAADMLMTPANIKKLAEFENKRQRVERERLAYEEDPEGYDLNSANALDAYVKSWNLKNLTPEQRTGTSTWKPGAADEATPPAGNAEVSRVAPDRGNGMSVDAGGSSGGEAPAPRRQSAGGAERPAPARSVPASKPAASPAPKGASKTNNGITTGPVNPRLKTDPSAGITTGPVNPNNSQPASVPSQEELIRKNDAEKVGLSEAKSLVSSVFAPMGSGGNGLEEASRNTPRAMSGITTGPTNPRSTSGPSRVAQLPPGQRGKYSPDMPSSKAAAYEAMAQMIPESIIPTALAGAALKGGLPRKMADKVETEIMPGVVNAGRKLAGRMKPSMGEPTIPEGFSKAPPNVRQGRMEGMGPAAKAAQLRAPEKPTRSSINQTIKAAEPTPSPRPKAPAKSATKAATSASEYLEKRDTSAASKAKAKSNIKQKKNQGKGQNL